MLGERKPQLSETTKGIVRSHSSLTFLAVVLRTEQEVRLSEGILGALD